MKTKVEKIETQVKIRLWGTHWVFIPMLLVIMILWVTGNGDAIKDGNFWYVLIVGVFGSLIRISKIPIISILISIALLILNGFDSFKSDEAMIATVFFVVVGMIYDHYLLKKEANERVVSKEEKPMYLDLMEEELGTIISLLYNKIEIYNLRLEKLNSSLIHEQKELEDAKCFSGSTINFEKAVERRETEIEGTKEKLSKTKVTVKELESASTEIHLEQKAMRLA